MSTARLILPVDVSLHQMKMSSWTPQWIGTWVQAGYLGRNETWLPVWIPGWIGTWGQAGYLGRIATWVLVWIPDVELGFRLGILIRLDGGFLSGLLDGLIHGFGLGITNRLVTIT